MRLSQRSSSNLMTFCYLAAYTYIWTAHDGQRDALFLGKADQIHSTPYWKATGYHARRGARKNVEGTNRTHSTTCA